MLDKQEAGLSEHQSRRELAADIRAFLTRRTHKRLENKQAGLQAVLQEEKNPALNSSTPLPPLQIDKIASSTLPEDSWLVKESRTQCAEIARVYYCLGEYLSPFYAAFADWVERKVAGLKNNHPVLVFSGRDSYPFLVAYNNRYPEKGKTERTWIPSSRLTLSRHYRQLDVTNAQEKEDLTAEKKMVAAFYERRGLTDRDLIMVDFGRKGKNERVHQAIMVELGGPRIQIKAILLAHKYDQSLFDAFLSPKSFDPAKVAEITEIDEALRPFISGFTNEIALAGNRIDFLYRAGEGTVSVANKNSFIMTFQEIGAGIKSTSGELFLDVEERSGVVPGHAFCSVQELIARYAFLLAVKRGTKNFSPTGNQEIAQRLNVFYNLWKKFPDVYGLTTDWSERASNDVELVRRVDQVNKVLRQRDEPELSLY